MEQRVSLITIGVSDMDRAAAFYEKMGWQRVQSPDDVIAFDLIGQTLGLYPLDRLADEMGLTAGDLGQGALTLSHNCHSEEDVRTILEDARSAGADILKEAQPVFWGGFHGYFRAPGNTIWEVAYNPFSMLGPTGEFRWNGYG
ncbi:VOC family protein [Primorskyibacter sp. S87]|uniref:VOC family protein n=1 Tax=Primorskyibacter sp. S87 TaxID=3415126 RepID=UPI003C7AF34A